MRTLDQVIPELPAAQRAKVLARGRQLISECIPNAETAAALEEAEAGGGRFYDGSTDKIIAE
jgi:hypothetical protein